MEIDQLNQKDKNNSEIEDTPPVFSSWNKWYMLVAGFLILQIICYYVLTSFFE